MDKRIKIRLIISVVLILVAVFLLIVGIILQDSKRIIISVAAIVILVLNIRSELKKK